MGWVMQMLGFGFLAFIMLLLSATFAWRKRYKLGLLFGGMELIAAGVSSSAWAWALKVSGKIDWFLLGLMRYTPIALICYAMFAVGTICLIVNFCGFIKDLDAAAEAATPA